MLSSQKQIKETILPSDYSKYTQEGIDLSVQKIERILDGAVIVGKEKTTVNPDKFENVTTISLDGNEVWRLEPGAYALTFNEKCVIPKNATGFIKSRSSIYRGGAQIDSPLWDPEFTSGKNFMGTTMIVNKVIFIEKNARVGQFYLIDSHPPEEGYNGQFQGKTNY